MKQVMSEQQLQQYLIDDSKRIGEIFIGKLYHGTNNTRYSLTGESCFTKNLETAKDYAYFWSCEAFEEIIGKPYVLVIEGEFIYMGSPDEYKLIKGKVIDIIEGDFK